MKNKSQHRNNFLSEIILKNKIKTFQLILCAHLMCALGMFCFTFKLFKILLNKELCKCNSKKERKKRKGFGSSTVLTKSFQQGWKINSLFLYVHICKGVHCINLTFLFLFRTNTIIRWEKLFYFLSYLVALVLHSVVFLLSVGIVMWHRSFIFIFVSSQKF